MEPSPRNRYLLPAACVILFAAACAVFFAHQDGAVIPQPSEERSYAPAPAAMKDAAAFAESNAAEESDAGRFIIVVLPDTQFYSRKYPDIFANQTRWVASRRGEMSIAFVIQEGDITDTADSDAEWRNANASLSLLDGVVPYSLVPGNHDKPTAAYNRYFPPSRFSSEPWYGGNFSGGDNSYQVFSAGGSDYLVLNLEFCPGKETMAWGNRVLAENRGRKAIVVTHGYINEKTERSVHVCGDTQYIWDGLVVPNNNVFLVLCGHIHGVARRSDSVGARRVHQVLADFQDEPNGGNGWLRLMEFSPGEGKIYVKTYSPYLGTFKTDQRNQFTLDTD
jgi:hypothetical protein